LGTCAADVLAYFFVFSDDVVHKPSYHNFVNVAAQFLRRGVLREFLRHLAHGGFKIFVQLFVTFVSGIMKLKLQSLFVVKNDEWYN
jgi:hypothetical protein